MYLDLNGIFYQPKRCESVGAVNDRLDQNAYAWHGRELMG